MLNNLKKLLQERLLYLTGKNFQLDICFIPSIKDIENPKDAIKRALIKSIKRENIFKTTVIGPHRDNFVFLNKGKDMKKFASQGEVRMAILALKLALVSFYEEFRNKYPVILLDDILLEIDRKNMERVLRGFSGKNQFFFSSTEIPDIPFFKELHNDSIFHIKKNTT